MPMKDIYGDSLSIMEWWALHCVVLRYSFRDSRDGDTGFFEFYKLATYYNSVYAVSRKIG